ncbi:ABC transporter ATP-binding protein [Candidatus Epulonipiscium viviparus]|uniref:ABC transporter ATP-binding protein n=1 Tax=Candidatus Epulonipiscium viviparus TaxID=420336 RepID=UPI0027380B63|nr:ABC transporter ATP-binding protein [Candidatus Epulopiscium viviparus]
MSTIVVNHISKQQGDFTLKDINFSLPSGKIMGLIGKNGAGKSTTINLIMNSIKPDSGEISVLGVKNTSRDFKNVKENIGLVLDESYIPDIFNVNDINKIMNLCYKQWDKQIYHKYINYFSLDPQKKFQDYSKGMKMKLGIAIALSHGSKVLILDEATSGLDPIAREEVLEILTKFVQQSDNHSVLISSHIISDLEKICDSITLIHQGRQVLSQDKKQILENYSIINVDEQELELLPKDIILGKKNHKGIYDVLIEKNKVSSINYPEQNYVLEDIILLMIRGLEEERKNARVISQRCLV